MLIMKDFITDREFTVGAVLAFAALNESNIAGCIQSIVYPEGDNLADVLPSGGVWVTDTKEHIYSWTMNMLKKLGDTNQEEFEEEEHRDYHHASVDNFETDFEVSTDNYLWLSALYVFTIKTHFSGYIKGVSLDDGVLTETVKLLIKEAEQKRLTVVRESGFSVNVTTFVINAEGAEILLPFIRRMLNYRYRVNNDDYVININGWLFKSAKMPNTEFDLYVQRNCRSILKKVIDSPTDFIRSLV